MSVYRNHKIYVLKIKVTELQFEVIPIVQNFLSQTHEHLESFISTSLQQWWFLKWTPFCGDKKGEKEKVWQIIKSSFANTLNTLRFVLQFYFNVIVHFACCLSNKFFRCLISWYYWNYLFLRLVVSSSSKRERLLNIRRSKVPL